MREETLYFCEYCSAVYHDREACIQHEQSCKDSKEEYFTPVAVITHQITADPMTMEYSKKFDSTDVLFKSSITGKLNREAPWGWMEAEYQLPGSGVSPVCIQEYDGKVTLTIRIRGDQEDSVDVSAILEDALEEWRRSYAHSIADGHFTRKGHADDN